MFSTIPSPSLFIARRRPERPHVKSRNNTTGNKSKGLEESGFVANVHLTLSGLNPNRTTITPRAQPLAIFEPTPPSSPRSFISTLSHRTARTAFSSSMSSGSSVRSFYSRSEYSTDSPVLKDSDMTPKLATFNGMKSKFKSKTKTPFDSSPQGAFHSRPVYLQAPRSSYTPRPSLDSVSTSSSGRSWIETKERKVPIVVPPPLRLNESNLRPKHSREPSLVEVVGPGPPRVESRLSSHANPVLTPPTPPSPQPIAEEEKRRRQLEKVTRTLGEKVPAELVYRGAVKPIMNVNVFPDPPSPTDGDTPTRRDHDNITSKLVRRASFTLSSFPNLSSVTATLRVPASHVRNKSQELLGLRDTPQTPKSLSQGSRYFSSDVATPTRGASVEIPRPRRRPRPRPESVMSPIIFAKTLESQQPVQPVQIIAGEQESGDPEPQSPQQRVADRAAKLTRRMSISTATILSSSPIQDSFDDITPRHSRRISSRQMHVTHPVPEDYLEPNPRERPESFTMSPLVFAKHTSLILPPSGPLPFRLTINDEDDSEDKLKHDEDTISTGSATPPSGERLPNRSGDNPGYRSHSNPHLPLQPRPGTPFSNSLVPLPKTKGYLAPHGTLKRVDGSEVIIRKERRQGWSGEWNQADMQEVIQKLRNLK